MSNIQYSMIILSYFFKSESTISTYILNFYIIDVKTNTANLNLQNADSAKSIGKKYAILRFF